MSILWSTHPDQDGIYQFVRSHMGKNEEVILRGLTFSGLEYLPKYKNDTINILLSFFDPDDPKTHTLNHFKIILRNVMSILCEEWGANLIRVPICVSAYSDNVKVNFQGDEMSYPYPLLVKTVIAAILEQDAVAVIDGHIWAVDSEGKMAYPQYCSFDFSHGRPTNTQNYGIQLYALQDLMEIETGNPIQTFVDAWNTIVQDTIGTFDNNQNIWFEFVNEPFYRQNDMTERTRFRHWRTFYHTLIKNARSIAPNNIIIVNGLDRGYDFTEALEELESIPYKSTRLLFEKESANIAYGVHPFQMASCCGLITSPGDNVKTINAIQQHHLAYSGKNSTLSKSTIPYIKEQSQHDPYEKAFCHFPRQSSNHHMFKENMRGDAFSIPSDRGDVYFDLPYSNQDTTLSKLKCNHSFYKSQSKKLPPCHFDDRLVDVRTQSAGTYVGDCKPSVIDSLQSGYEEVPASGWDKYFLDMRHYGPVIATAFGTFDCSLPYIISFLEYAEMHDLSWIAFGIQAHIPNRMYKHNLNPCNLSCLTVPAMSPVSGFRQVKSVLPSGKKIGNYLECLDKNNCSLVLTPIGNKDGYGETIKQYIQLNIQREDLVITSPQRQRQTKSRFTRPRRTLAPNPRRRPYMPNRRTVSPPRRRPPVRRPTKKPIVRPPININTTMPEQPIVQPPPIDTNTTMPEQPIVQPPPINIDTTMPEQPIVQPPPIDTIDTTMPEQPIVQPPPIDTIDTTMMPEQPIVQPPIDTNTTMPEQPVVPNPIAPGNKTPISGQKTKQSSSNIGYIVVFVLLMMLAFFFYLFKYKRNIFSKPPRFNIESLRIKLSSLTPI